MLANQVDFQIKDLLMELANDCVEIETMCCQKKLWAKKTEDNQILKKGNIYLFQKTKNGNYRNQDGELIENIDEYIDINSDVSEQIQDLGSNIESAITRIEYVIENNQF